MIHIIIGLLFTFIWIAFEIWSAPVLEETENGKFITKRPQRKLKDLFKKKK